MKKYLVNLKGGHMSAKLFREAREDFGLAHGDLLDIAEGDCEEYDEDCVIDKNGEYLFDVGSWCSTMFGSVIEVEQ